MLNIIKAFITKYVISLLISTITGLAGSLLYLHLISIPLLEKKITDLEYSASLYKWVSDKYVETNSRLSKELDKKLEAKEIIVYKTNTIIQKEISANKEVYTSCKITDTHLDALKQKIDSIGK